MRKVVELIRVSTEGQAAETSASIPAQRNVNRQTAASFGLTIVRSIEISDVSGAAVLFAPVDPVAGHTRGGHEGILPFDASGKLF